MIFFRCFSSKTFHFPDQSTLYKALNTGLEDPRMKEIVGPVIGTIANTCASKKMPSTHFESYVAGTVISRFYEVNLPFMNCDEGAATLSKISDIVDAAKPFAKEE
jgi:hypothetical protein